MSSACRRSSAARASSRSRPSPRAGLPHLKIAGQKGWHGVAIASRLPLSTPPPLDALPRRPRALRRRRRSRAWRSSNFYIPAGGDTPDREANPKFDHKLDFYEKLTAEMARRDPQGAAGCSSATSTSRRASMTCGTTGTCRRSSATRRSRWRRWRRCGAALGFIDLVRDAVPDRRSCSRGGATAPQDFRRLQPRPAARPPVDHARACARPPSARDRSRPASTMTSAAGSDPATTRR